MEFTEFTEASGREEPPTDFTDAHRLGGYGIPAIPTPPSANPPTEFTEFTEVSGARYSPTDFADAHRWLGCVGFCGEIVWWLCGYGRMPYPPNLCTSVKSVGDFVLLVGRDSCTPWVADAKSALISLSLRSFVVYLQCKQYIGLWANTSIRSPTGASSDCSDRSSASRC